MQLSEHFTLEELTASPTALARGINNSPSEEVVANLKALSSNLLELLRKAVDMPLTVTSGYRSEELNRAVGGKPTSQHLRGEAADLVCGDMSLLWQKAQELKNFDQLIWEGSSKQRADDGRLVFVPRWVHISYKRNPYRNRRQVLHIPKP